MYVLMSYRVMFHPDHYLRIEFEFEFESHACLYTHKGITKLCGAYNLIHI